MSNPADLEAPETYVQDGVHPDPVGLYSLDMAAHVAAVPRRSMLIYCRLGLVQPVYQIPYGMMSFTEAAIHKVRIIEHVRLLNGLAVDSVCLKTIVNLQEEVERLREELRVRRSHD